VGLTLIKGGRRLRVAPTRPPLGHLSSHPVLIGHILIASGALPGYRGVARAMHLGGRLRRDVAERVWPGWLDRQDSLPSGQDAPGRLVGPGRLERPDGPDGPTR
jgi:hypothetical protein